MTEDEILRSAMDSAKEAVKACLVINGGAAVALLAFMGHFVNQNHYERIADLATPLVFFVLGVIATPITHALSYGANLYFFWLATTQQRVGSVNLALQTEYRLIRKARTYRIAGVVCTLGSIICFVIGSYTSYNAFASFAKSKAKAPTTIQQSK